MRNRNCENNEKSAIEKYSYSKIVKEREEEIKKVLDFNLPIQLLYENGIISEKDEKN